MSRNNFPHYRQLDAMDCGATCLRMIAKYYGKSYTDLKVNFWHLEHFVNLAA